MRGARVTVVLSLAAVLCSTFPGATAPAPPQAPTFRQFLSPASPLEIVAAKKVDRLAWPTFEEGKRNVFTAAAPAFVPRRLTNFLKDDGIDLSDVQISDDGAVVTFMRGMAPNRLGWAANPSANPDGPERAVWAARTAGGAAWRVVSDVAAPRLASDGSAVLFVRDGQIHRAKVTPVPPGERDRSRRETVHTGVGRAERADVVTGRAQDRLRQPPDRSQLRRRLRPGHPAHHLHVAERRFRLDTACGRRTAKASSSCAGPACPTGSRRSRALAASATRAALRSRAPPRRPPAVAAGRAARAR